MVRASRNVSNARRQADAWERLAASAGPHEAFSGTHFHAHPAYNAADADDDGQHSHPHDHDDDGYHGHDHQAASNGRYAKHVRFERGGVRTLNSARGALYSPKAPGAAIDGQYRSLGELVRAAFRASNGTGPKLLNAAMSERIPAEGGALVPEHLRSDVMFHALESAIIRPRATVIPMAEQAERVPVLEEGSDSAGSIFGGLQFSWTEEAAALSSSVASYGLDVLRAKKLIAYMVAPNELYADANKLDTFLNDVIPAGLAFAEDAAFIAGSGNLGGTTLGASQPAGILSAGCQITVTRAGSPVNLADIANMATRMLPQSMNRYIWLASPDIFKTLLQIYLAVGSPTTQAVAPSEWLYYNDDEQCWCLLGRPIYSTEHVSAAGTQGDLVAVDPKFVVIGDYQEMTIEIATEGVDFINNQSQIRIRSRLDSRVWLNQPVTPANSSETVSPVIILK